MEKRTTALTVLNTVGFIAIIVLNALANALPLNGKNTGEISDAYPNLFVPAGLTFAIWGVIYTLLAAFIVYSIIATVRKNISSDFIEQIGPWFIISSVLNVLWIVAWHWEVIPLTLILMLMLFATLIKIYLTLEEFETKDNAALLVCVKLPFSVYLGWITVATIANVTALLVSLNWNGFGLAESFWAVLVILVAISITAIMILRRRNYAYSLVIIWALLGIWIKRSANTVTPDTAVELVSMIGLISLAVLVIVKAALTSQQK